MKTENNWENMNDEQFAEVVKAWPWYALKYPHACKRMSAVQFDAALKARPGYALESSRVQAHEQSAI